MAEEGKVTASVQAEGSGGGVLLRSSPGLETKGMAQGIVNGGPIFKAAQGGYRARVASPKDPQTGGIDGPNSFEPRNQLPNGTGAACL